MYVPMGHSKEVKSMEQRVSVWDIVLSSGDPGGAVAHYASKFLTTKPHGGFPTAPCCLSQAQLLGVLKVTQMHILACGIKMIE